MDGGWALLIIGWVLYHDKMNAYLILHKLLILPWQWFRRSLFDMFWRYLFKSLDPEFGTVKEELVDDDEVLPGWEGKVIGWIEEELL